MVDVRVIGKRGFVLIFVRFYVDFVEKSFFRDAVRGEHERVEDVVVERRGESQLSELTGRSVQVRYLFDEQLVRILVYAEHVFVVQVEKVRYQ